MLKSYFFVYAMSLILGAGAFFPRQALAAEIATIPTLPSVTVTAAPLNDLSSTVIRDADLIERLPSSHGNLTELLKTVPGVQFSEGLESSKTGGEILPPEVSISGGRSHENNFIIDGLSINNLIDPSSTTNTVDNIPGHSLEYFIPEHLLKSITVYRSNIPARYGSFTGGVVVAETKDPEPEFSGEISYKTTRSQWGEFHVDAADEDEFYNSTDASNQPEFEKQNTTALITFPVTDNSSGLISYSRLESSIPLTLINQQHVEYRKTENFFYKLQIEPDSSTKVTLSASYTPHKADLYLKNTLNSDYDLESGGYILDGKINKKTNLGRIEFSLSWKQNENSRQAPQDWKNWQVTDSKSWGGLIGKNVSVEGGFGDIEKQQQSLSSRINFDFKELATGRIRHNLNAGIEVDRTEATFDRQETTSRYSAGKKSTTVDCNGDNSDCIDGEQFFWFKNIYPQDIARAEISNYHAYIDNDIKLARLSLRPGLRISYNDLQKNTDYAPRFAAAYDLFGNQKTLFTGGINRYYGGEILAHQLAEQKAPYQVWSRLTTLVNNQPRIWEKKDRTSINTNKVSDLKTPYSDEYTLGLKQKLFGGELELLYIDRDYKDQLMTETLAKDADGYIYQEYRNEGRRYHEEFSIAWERSWQKHYLSANLTWQETKSNSLDYSDIFDPDVEAQLVWYHGKPVSVDKLLTSDFNRPYTASLTYAINLPKGFSFSNVTRYSSHYRAVEKTSAPPHTYDGIALDVYDDVKKPSAVTFDWKLLWQSPEWHSNSIEFFLDILNVFNRKVAIGNATDEYKLGRQYWAGMTYKF